MPTTTLTVDNELLSATSIYDTLSHLSWQNTNAFTVLDNLLRVRAINGSDLSKPGITLRQQKDKLVMSR